MAPGATDHAIGADAVTDFTQQLATLLQAGVPLDRALGMLAETVGQGRFAEVVTDLQTRVRQGTTLADGLADFAAAHATILLGKGHAHQPQLGRLFDGLVGHPVLAVDRPGQRPDLVFAELAHHAAEELVFLGEREIHGPTSYGRISSPSAL